MPKAEHCKRIQAWPRTEYNTVPGSATKSDAITKSSAVRSTLSWNTVSTYCPCASTIWADTEKVPINRDRSTRSDIFNLQIDNVQCTIYLLFNHFNVSWSIITPDFSHQWWAVYILSFSNPCATFALGLHIFFCSKWHIDSTKKRLFAGGIIFLQLSLRCGDNSYAVRGQYPLSKSIRSAYAIQIIPYGITMSKITCAAELRVNTEIDKKVWQVCQTEKYTSMR